MRGGPEELVVEAEAGRLSCPYCKGCQTVLNGARKGRQGYLCKVCGKQFRQGAMGGHSFPPDQIGAAIQIYYTLLSFRKAARELKDRFGILDTDVSPETIRNWVRRYTDAAIRLPRDLKTLGGGRWWIFRRVTARPLHRDWMLVLDDKTGYILGNCVSAFNEDDRAPEVLKEAWTSAGRPFDELVTVSMKPHWDWRSTVGSEVVPWSWTVDKLIGGYLIRDPEHTGNFPPGFTAPKIFREYHQACARFEWNSDTGKVRRHLAGWTITRNWCTKQTELGGHTPVQAAGIESPISAWIDVVRLEARAFLNTVDPKATVATRHPSEDACEQMQMPFPKIVRTTN